MTGRDTHAWALEAERQNPALRPTMTKRNRKKHPPIATAAESKQLAELANEPDETIDYHEAPKAKTKAKHGDDPRDLQRLYGL